MTAIDHTQATNRQDTSRALRWTVGSFTAVIGVSVVAGVAAALFGGSLTDLGSGAGGLYGIPALLTTATAFAAGLREEQIALAAFTRLLQDEQDALIQGDTERL